MDDTRLLIVDDDPEICETLSDIFKEKGYDVTIAHSGRECIEKAQNKEYDVALIDGKLPDTHGALLIKQLKTIHPDVICIIITAQLSLDHVLIALRDGANDYLKKPLDLPEALDKIQTLLEKQRYQRQLRESEVKYRGLIQGSTNAIVTFDENRNINLWNDAATNLFGYTINEATGQSIDMLFTDNYDKRQIDDILYSYDPYITKGMGKTIELIAKRRDNSTFPIELTLSLHKKDKKLASGIMRIRDITARKEAEETITRSYYIQSVISTALQISLEPISIEEQLRRILDLILSISWIALESKGCIYLVESNPELLIMKANCHLTESLLEKCTTVPFGHCLCGKAASEGAIQFSDCIDSRHETEYIGMQQHGHYCVPIISGERVLGVINLYVKEGHQRNEKDEQFLQTIANTLAGIIERRGAEMERERLQEQLIQSEKLSALGRLTANVAHEIRNPLTALGGFARRLHNKIMQGTRERGYSEIIISEVDRLERILKSVLTFSSNITLDLQKHHIVSLLEEALKNYEAICREQSIYIHQSYRETPLILADKDRMKEAIENILSNAIDSMSNGGVLTMATSTEFIHGVSYVAVKIMDQGGGISEDKLRMIFEPFFTTKAIGQFYGTGLGLSISRKILEKHCGFITVESELGKGSTFSLYIPFQHEEESTKTQCWQYFGCGRDSDLKNKCPSFPHFGRSCWAIAGAYCAGKIQGTHAQKIMQCKKCPFYMEVFRSKKSVKCEKAS